MTNMRYEHNVRYLNLSPLLLTVRLHDLGKLNPPSADLALLTCGNIDIDEMQITKTESSNSPIFPLDVPLNLYVCTNVVAFQLCKISQLSRNNWGINVWMFCSPVKISNIRKYLLLNLGKAKHLRLSSCFSPFDRWFSSLIKCHWNFQEKETRRHQPYICCR